jgi:hypothetical protein
VRPRKCARASAGRIFLTPPTPDQWLWGTCSSSAKPQSVLICTVGAMGRRARGRASEAGQRAVMKTSPRRRLRNSLGAARRPARQAVCLCIAAPTVNVRFCRDGNVRSVRRPHGTEASARCSARVAASGDIRYSGPGGGWRAGTRAVLVTHGGRGTPGRRCAWPPLRLAAVAPGRLIVG